MSFSGFKHYIGIVNDSEPATVGLDIIWSLIGLMMETSTAMALIASPCGMTVCICA